MHYRPAAAPDETRDHLLNAAFAEMHRHGFRGASIGNIVKRTGVTKGALYHHFPSKTALGYAVVDEVLYPAVRRDWARLLERDAHPIDTLLEIGRELVATSTEGRITLGCPVNNLVQEMAGLDEGFRTRLDAILSAWRRTIETALAGGQARREVRSGIDPADTAAFIVAAFEGSIGLAKSAHSAGMLRHCLAGLVCFLNGLRAPEAE